MDAGEFEKAGVMLEHIIRDMVKEEGITMISGGYDNPDMEQFDQMGEYMYTMKSYVDWTGDTSILQKYRNKIIKLIERPICGSFQDATGMLHNRREFWERNFQDGYELAYQMLPASLLRKTLKDGKRRPTGYGMLP